MEGGQRKTIWKEEARISINANGVEDVWIATIGEAKVVANVQTLGAGSRSYETT